MKSSNSKLRTVLTLVLATRSWAAVDGSITGTVTEPLGEAIPGVLAVATNTVHGIQTKTVNDEHGQYALPSLAVGTYALAFQSPRTWRTAVNEAAVIHVVAAWIRPAGADLDCLRRFRERLFALCATV